MCFLAILSELLREVRKRYFSYILDKKQGRCNDSQENIIKPYKRYLIFYNVNNITVLRGDTMKYYLIGEFSKLIGKTPQTLRNCCKTLLYYSKWLKDLTEDD